MKCKLCNEKEADQTGSHITSAFLLASQIGKRGEENGYLITTNPEQDYSKNQGDTGIKEDFILCRGCEKRLGVVESIYATEITQKIEDEKYEQNFERIDFENGHYKLNCKKISSIAFQLLIQSNIWRASISKQPVYAHFQLSPELEERLRFNLDLFLPTYMNNKISQSEKDWIKMIEACKDIFDCIPLATIKAEKIENKDATFEFFDNLSKNPYHIILNEYVIYLFNNSLDWYDDFFELKDEFILNEIINDVPEKAIITIISNERYMQIVEKIRDLAVKQRIKKIEKQCIKELLSKGVQITPDVLKQMVIEKVNEIKM
ncbi:hypothetical protein M2451_003117 [Dysgonomonas sp. PFB1-18]|uniref:hypothetical protein n=1 Tax=unclassified Dysgonomonas TaxID=2630389 RepID=UPI0013D45C37|nr:MULTISPECIES: hypothetical protein [unclassified Dysgonomonas]MDH6310293.1 hypothetical protein [Dysgonomonas sp. PF1-14]MDH6340110.1 hypothetical protein [Dysgonomonas sp. PF1-16]MDH6381782.1 hypothetical protein [Dysgonomonas sp. PFB1-18]MDH6398976.1 hypothetical protein [Dysgonomonas sp. PF1-23]NDV93376.1 hypothetical protein [Dysgonomonas sp. 521]